MKNSNYCTHTGNIEAMNKVNKNKVAFDSQQSKAQMNNQDTSNSEHNKKGSHIAYPEEKTDQSVQCAQCISEKNK